MSRLDKLLDEIRGEMNEAYKRGFSEGQEAMRAIILNVAAKPIKAESAVDDDFQVPLPISFSEEIGAVKRALRERAATSNRAPRGAVGRMLERVLQQFPGELITAQIELIKDEFDSAVSVKSIGNELRRLEGIKYKRDREGRWSLVGGAEMKSGGD